MGEISEDMLEEVKRLFEEWLNEPERTDKVREIARKYPPWNTYYNKPTGQRASIVAYAEDGTVRANCWHEYAEMPEPMRSQLEQLSAVQVFGMDPSDFEVAPSEDA